MTDPQPAESILERIDLAWQAGYPLDLVALDIQDPVTLREAVHTDLEYRIKRGHPQARVEYYLERFEGLDPLDLLETEWTQRAQQGDRAGLEHYQRRFPAISAAIREKWVARTTLGCSGLPQWDLATQLPGELSRFELRGKLGAGGFGDVYQAYDRTADRLVAIKIPNRLSPQVAQRFSREVQSTAQLNHPNIVQIYEVGKASGQPYLVTRFIQGIPLSRAMAGHRFQWRETATLLRVLASALAYAHRKGVVHRDMKPDNILLEMSDEASTGAASLDTLAMQGDVSTLFDSPHADSGSANSSGTGLAAFQIRPTIVDFGMAHRDLEEDTLTREGDLLGTPAYMSPEQAAGKAQAADGRMDVFSLGVIMYELLTGERPFRGSLTMLIEQILSDEPLAPRRLDHRIPRDLETICLKCLRKLPQRRYSAQELEEDLSRWLEGLPIQARPVSRRELAWNWIKRNRRVTSLAAALLLVLLGSLVIVSYFWQDSMTANRYATRQRQAAVDAFVQLVRTQRDELSDLPGLAEVRHQFLQKAVQGLEALEQESDPLEVVDPGMAEAYLQMGLLLHRFQGPGGLAQAQTYIQRALEMAEQQVEQSPQDSNLQFQLAECYRELGNVQIIGQEFAQAKNSLSRALDLSRHNYERWPGRESRQALADSHRSLANWCEYTGDYPQAEKHLREAMDRDRSSVSDGQGLPGYVELETQLNLADVLFNLDRASDALGILESLWSQLSRVPEEAFTKITWIRLRYLTANRLSGIWLDRGEAAKVRPLLQDSLQWTEELNRRDPQNIEIVRDLSAIHELWGQFSAQAGENEKALQHFQRMGEYAARRMSADPSDIDAMITTAQASAYAGRVAHLQGLKKFDNFLIAREKYLAAIDLMRPYAESNRLNDAQLDNFKQLNQAVVILDNIIKQREHTSENPTQQD